MISPTSAPFEAAAAHLRATLARLHERVRLATFISSSLLAATVSLAQHKVLFIGNSLTLGDHVDGNVANDVSVPAIFEALALAAGQPAPFVAMSAVGGSDFQYHAGMDANAFQGTLDAIGAQPWTHIILQNFSTEPTHIVDGSHSVADHLTYGGALYLVAMDLNPKPTVLLYETWARAAAHGIYTGASTNSTFVSPGEFQNEVWFNYRRLLNLLNNDPANAANPPVKISPVGDAWQSSGALETSPATNLFASDLYHGNDNGYYLSAAVFYSEIYGASPVGLHNSSQVAALGLNLSSPEFLEQVAWAVVTEETEPQTTFLIDFGASGTVTAHGASPDDPTYFWNNVPTSIGTSSNGSVPGLVTTSNAASNVALEMIVRFNGGNSEGTQASSLFPTNATRDSLFGNTEIFNGLANVFPSFKFTGLSVAQVYTFTFYASRTGVSDNRETRYTITGGTLASAELNAANNTDQSVTVFGIAPTAGGEITVSIAPTANNNSANHFTYLGALRLDEAPTVLSAPVITSATSAAATLNTPFAFLVTATGAPTNFTAAGLPPGLAINPFTGVISGLPTLLGSFNASLGATNIVGTGSGSLAITVSKIAASITLSNLAQTYDGSPKSVTATTNPAGLAVNVTYAGSAAVPSAIGSYPVVATISDANYAGLATGTLVIAPNTRLVNMSARTLVGTGSDILIQGFVITGTGTKSVLIRGIGPTLAAFNVPGVLAAPTLTLVTGGVDIATNTGWSTSPDAAAIALTAAAVNAFPLPPGSADSALLVTLAPGSYTAKLSGVGGTTGVGLVEIYDADVAPSTAVLVNLSARARVGTGADVLIPGFVSRGDGARRYLVRAIGPTLGSFNVPGVLADPTLTIFAGATAVATNDDWSSAANAADIIAVSQQVQAFPLASSAKDAVALVTLSPGPYTVVVSGVGGTSGVALVEIYDVPE